MRIIAGKHRSRILKTLEGPNTRPMMDRMKESIFNTIGPYLDSGNVLDLFGGSGALSLEAISRGAKHAYISELSREAYNVIGSNVTSLKEDDNVTVLNMDYKIALKRFGSIKFDYVFLDPPYRMNIINELLAYLKDNDMLNDKAFIICHYVAGNVTINQDYRLIKNYTHDKHEYTIYQNV